MPSKFRFISIVLLYSLNPVWQCKPIRHLFFVTDLPLKLTLNVYIAWALVFCAQLNKKYPVCKVTERKVFLSAYIPRSSFISILTLLVIAVLTIKAIPCMDFHDCCNWFFPKWPNGSGNVFRSTVVIGPENWQIGCLEIYCMDAWLLW